MYKSSESTCGKWEKRKSACTNQASVPAVSVRGGKRTYKPGTYTCENMDAGKYGHNLDSLTLSVAEKNHWYLGGIFQNESNHFYISIHFGRHNIESAFFCIKLYIFLFISGGN